MDNNKKNTITTFDGGVADEQIQQWKNRYGKVVRIEVQDDGDTHVGYFHRPKLEDMSAIMKLAKTDELKSSEVMFNNCWLGGSEAMRHDAILFIETTKQLATMLGSCRSSLKNL